MFYQFSTSSILFMVFRNQREVQTNVLTFGEIAPDAQVAATNGELSNKLSTSNEKLSNKFAHLRRDSA